MAFLVLTKAGNVYRLLHEYKLCRNHPHYDANQNLPESVKSQVRTRRKMYPYGNSLKPDAVAKQ